MAVLGIPYDLGTTGRAGTRHGPQGIRLASANLRWEERRWPWTFDAFKKIAIVDYGDLEFTPGETLPMINTVIEHVGKIQAQAGRTFSVWRRPFCNSAIIESCASTSWDFSAYPFLMRIQIVTKKVASIIMGVCFIMLRKKVL